MSTPAQPDVAGAAVITLLITTCAWLQLDQSHPLLLAMTAAALLAAPFFPVPPAAPSIDPAADPRALTWVGLRRSLPIAALICAPGLILLIGTLGEEFPFSGDHVHHLIMGRVSRDFWIDHLAPVVGFGAAIWLVRRSGFRFWALVAFAALFAWSFAGVAPDSATRYPATGYLLDLPLQVVANRGSWASPLDAHRITTAASLLCWLFLLRPLVVGKWPDLGIAPFALFFFWQQDVVYYGTTAYLEPWSIVFVLAAVELLASDRPTRSWLPVLLVGVACAFKEQAVLILPWVWLAALATIPRTRRAWGAAALNGLLAIAPFLFWYQAVRPMSGFARKSGLAPWSQLASLHRLRVFGWRLYEQFGTVGLVLLAVAIGLAIARAWRDAARRRLTLCLLGAAVTQVAFFYVDRASIPWTGYPRFQLFALALIGLAAWLPGPRMLADPRARAIAAIAIALAQLTTLAGTLRLAARPDPARDYFEHRDAPIYFPIRSLVTEAEDAGVLAPSAKISLNKSKSLTSLMVKNDGETRDEIYSPMELVYPTLAGHEFVGGVTDCRCDPGHEALIVRVPYPARLRADEADQPLPVEDAACLAAVDATYVHVYRRELDGRPTGVLGVGCKALR